MTLQSLALLVAMMTVITPALGQPDTADSYGQWMEQPQSEWPQITMVSQIEYTDAEHPIAGCGFLLDTGDEILAATAKHVLIFFKSPTMESVDFAGSLKAWRMFPKNSPSDTVLIDRLINTDSSESLEEVPAKSDWLLFTLSHRTPDVQPLRLRTDPLEAGEPIYIIGWRYSDVDCPQVIYQGEYVKEEDGTLIVTAEELADNTMPGLSGSPVIDSQGYVIGLMSQKAGDRQRLSSLDYPRRILEERKRPR